MRCHHLTGSDAIHRCFCFTCESVQCLVVSNQPTRRHARRAGKIALTPANARDKKGGHVYQTAQGDKCVSVRQACRSANAGANVARSRGSGTGKASRVVAPWCARSGCCGAQRQVSSRQRSTWRVEGRIKGNPTACMQEAAQGMQAGAPRHQGSAPGTGSVAATDTGRW